MNNFAVIELASSKTTRAPGWAYVPDVGPTPAQALQPTNRKRAARNQAGLSVSDVSARQDAKIRKDLEVLDRDTNKDVNIPIPPKASGSRASNKHTSNVRKILQSQKTFANYLDDYQALLALAETNPAAAAALNPANAAQPKTAPPSTARNSPAPPPPEPKSSAASKRAAAAAKRAAVKEAKEAEEAAAAAKTKGGSKSQATTESKSEPSPENVDTDVEMTDAPDTAATEIETSQLPEYQSPSNEPPKSYPPDGTILPAYNKPPPPVHPGDNDPLLVSRVPPFPTDEELRGLMTAMPLSYLEARASWAEEEGRYPARVFCEVCGYWGRVRCMKCGARVCALECLETHREECVTRYGL